MMLAPLVETEEAHVVRAPSGRVLLICWGNDAGEVAAGWAARGYRVSSVAWDALDL